MTEQRQEDAARGLATNSSSFYLIQEIVQGKDNGQVEGQQA